MLPIVSATGGDTKMLGNTCGTTLPLPRITTLKVARVIPVKFLMA